MNRLHALVKLYKAAQSSPNASSGEQKQRRPATPSTCAPRCTVSCTGSSTMANNHGVLLSLATLLILYSASLCQSQSIAPANPLKPIPYGTVLSPRKGLEARAPYSTANRQPPALFASSNAQADLPENQQQQALTAESSNIVHKFKFAFHNQPHGRLLEDEDEVLDERPVSLHRNSRHYESALPYSMGRMNRYLPGSRSAIYVDSSEELVDDFVPQQQQPRAQSRRNLARDKYIVEGDGGSQNGKENHTYTKNFVIPLPTHRLNDRSLATGVIVISQDNGFPSFRDSANDDIGRQFHYELLTIPTKDKSLLDQSDALTKDPAGAEKQQTESDEKNDETEEDAEERDSAEKDVETTKRDIERVFVPDNEHLGNKRKNANDKVAALTITMENQHNLDVARPSQSPPSDYIASSLKARIHLSRPSTNSFNINLVKTTRTSDDQPVNETFTSAEEPTGLNLNEKTDAQPLSKSDNGPSLLLLVERETMLNKMRKNNKKVSKQTTEEDVKSESTAEIDAVARARRRQSRPSSSAINLNNALNKSNFVLKQRRNDKLLRLNMTAAENGNSTERPTELTTTSILNNLVKELNLALKDRIRQLESFNQSMSNSLTTSTAPEVTSAESTTALPVTTTTTTTTETPEIKVTTTTETSTSNESDSSSEESKNSEDSSEVTSTSTAMPVTESVSVKNDADSSEEDSSSEEMSSTVATTTASAPELPSATLTTTIADSREENSSSEEVSSTTAVSPTTTVVPAISSEEGTSSEETSEEANSSTEAVTTTTPSTTTVSTTTSTTTTAAPTTRSTAKRESRKKQKSSSTTNASISNKKLKKSSQLKSSSSASTASTLVKATTSGKPSSLKTSIIGKSADIGESETIKLKMNVTLPKSKNANGEEQQVKRVRSASTTTATPRAGSSGKTLRLAVGISSSSSSKKKNKSEIAKVTSTTTSTTTVSPKWTQKATQSQIVWNLWNPSTTAKPTTTEKILERRPPGPPKIPNNFGFSNTIRESDLFDDDDSDEQGDDAGEKLTKRQSASSKVTPPVADQPASSKLANSAKETPKKIERERDFEEDEDSESDDDEDDLADTNVPGTPGVDYPVLSHIPDTSFDCSKQQYPGFYADMEVGCQVYHSCSLASIAKPESILEPVAASSSLLGRRSEQISGSEQYPFMVAESSPALRRIPSSRKSGLNGGKHSFLCPNGTIFSQEYSVCDWWYNIQCNESPRFYPLNRDVFTSGQNSNNQQNPPVAAAASVLVADTVMPGVPRPTPYHDRITAPSLVSRMQPNSIPSTK